MGKLLKFSDQKFFGSKFTEKYNAFKEEIIRNAGPVDINGIHRNLAKIIGLEGKHRERLTILAIETSKNMFPVIDICGIQIDAVIEDNISHEDISEDGTPDFPEEIPEIDEKLYKKAAKQKVLNAFSQGAAVSMNSIHHMVAELDEISLELKPTYDQLMKANEVAYLTVPEEMFIQAAIAANGDENIGGTNKVEFRDGVPYIVARAVNFVNLVHEIIKGLYTYLALNAYETEYEYYEISQYTDSIASEIEDIGCGKMVVGLLRDYLLDNFDKYYVHECFFEMVVVAIAKLPAEEMVTLMNGLVNGTPNKVKFEIIARNCFYDLKEFDKKSNGF